MTSALIRNIPIRSYAWETILLAELERALLAGDITALAALDRVRDAAGLPPSHRVRERLQQTEKPHVRT
jgi:hypothetical protein